MKVRTIAALVVATAALAGCSSTSSGTSAQSGPTDTLASTAPAATDGSSPAGDGSTSTTSGSATASGTSKGSSTSAGSGKPVAALLAKVKPAIDSNNRLSSGNAPKAQPAWIAAVTKTDSNGKSIASAQGVSVNLVALVDEAAKTEDLDSLVKLCYLDCDQLPKLMPAKDASGHTGFERLSELLEKTHPAPGNSQSPTMDFPGFAASNHGAATTVDQTDMKLLGVGAQQYSGLRTGFMAEDGANPVIGWDAVLAPDM